MEGSGDEMEVTPVTDGRVMEKIELGRSRGQVRGVVDMQAMDENATCICRAVHDKETEEQGEGRVPMERAAVVVVRDLVMGRDGGRREAILVGRVVSPSIAIRLVARGGYSSTGETSGCWCSVPLVGDDVAKDTKGYSLYRCLTLCHLLHRKGTPS